jgi:hypothetical protein
VGIWEHGRDYALLERESFDFVDDCAWYFRLVLRHLLRAGEVKGGIDPKEHDKRGAKVLGVRTTFLTSITHQM